MKRRPRWFAKNRGQVKVAPFKFIDVENALVVGKPIPPAVELTPVESNKKDLATTDPSHPIAAPAEPRTESPAS